MSGNLVETIVLPSAAVEKITGFLWGQKCFYDQRKEDTEAEREKFKVGTQKYKNLSQTANTMQSLANQAEECYRLFDLLQGHRLAIRVLPEKPKAEGGAE